MRHTVPLRLLAVLIALPILLFDTTMGRAQNLVTAADDLARQADIIAVGHVSSLVPQWDENRARIRTQVTIAVSQSVKGTASGSTITLVVPGGELDGVGEIYSDTPVFRKDEDVLVFAQRSTQGLLHVAGGLDGKYTISRDTATGREMISDRLSVDELTARLKKAVETQSLKQ